MPSLQTLPPELLLHTISFLPTQTLLPLTRTSHYLHTFISTHASSICNTHVTTHFPLEAAVLHPVLKDGWLVPTLPGVKETCEKYCEQPLGSLFKDSMTRWGRKMMLGEPGPQFLRFLEVYGRDIRVRAAMEIAALDTTPEENEKSPPTKPDFHKMSTQHIVQKLTGNERFESAINMYCITPFLSSIARSNHEFGVRDTRAEQRAEKRRLFKCKLKRGLKNIKQKAQNVFQKPNSDGISETTLLFGEIHREKSTSPFEERKRQESVGQGMMWYYGRTGVAPLEERGEGGLGKASFLLRGCRGVLLTWCSTGKLGELGRMRERRLRVRGGKWGG